MVFRTLPRQTFMRGMLVLACFVSGSCAILVPPKKRTIEQQNAKHTGGEYKVMAVIAGDDSRGGLRMSVMVRRQLTEGGWQAVQRSGRWATENDAMGDICPQGAATNVDAVVFVYYNQLSLFDCRDRLLSYQIEGGDDLGIEGMARKLIEYLSGGQVPASGTNRG